MRADLRPTREKLVAVGWILLPTFGAVLIILAACVYQWRQNNVRYSEFITREKPLSEALGNIYQKVMADKSVSNPAAVFIHPGDIRKALARGPNDLGELPSWVAVDEVYVIRADVALGSGRFICFVRFDATNAPYGLTSAGECRPAALGEIYPQDFISVQSTDR